MRLQAGLQESGIEGYLPLLGIPWRGAVLDIDDGQPHRVVLDRYLDHIRDADAIDLLGLRCVSAQNCWLHEHRLYQVADHLAMLTFPPRSPLLAVERVAGERACRSTWR